MTTPISGAHCITDPLCGKAASAGTLPFSMALFEMIYNAWFRPEGAFAGLAPYFPPKPSNFITRGTSGPIMILLVMEPHLKKKKKNWRWVPQFLAGALSSNGNISTLLALCVGNSPVTGEFPAQRPVTRHFDIFFDLRLNKQLSKQWWGWSLLRHHLGHHDVIVMDNRILQPVGDHYPACSIQALCHRHYIEGWGSYAL